MILKTNPFAFLTKLRYVKTIAGKEITMSDSNESHEVLYQILANEILHLKLKPGDRLSEHDLCERFGLSRTPVRSLLQRLQENGLVKIVPKRGSAVTRLNLDIVNQLIYERLAVETMVLRDYIAARTPADVERVRYLYLQMQEISKTYPDMDSASFFDADLRMHSEWFHRMNLDFLWARLSSPQSSYTRFCVLDILAGQNVPDVLSEHSKMLDLIERQDTSGIEELLRLHLYGGFRRLGTKIYTDYAAYFEPFGGE